MQPDVDGEVSPPSLYGGEEPDAAEVATGEAAGGSASGEQRYEDTATEGAPPPRADGPEDTGAVGGASGTGEVDGAEESRRVDRAIEEGGEAQAADGGEEGDEALGDERPPALAGLLDGDADEGDVEVSGAALTFWRIAIVLLVAATVVGLIALGSEGRAARAWSTVSSGADRALGAVDEGLGTAVGAVADATSATVTAVGDAWDRWTGRLQDFAASEPDPRLMPVAAEDAASLLVVVTDDGGAAVSIALFATSPDGEQNVVLFPPSLLAAIPGYGDFPLAETPRFENAELAALSIVNLLGIRIDAVAQLAPGDLARLVDASVVVDLPRSLVIPDGEDGTILAEEGTAELSPAVFEAAITARGEGDELAWLERQGAVWDALLDVMVERPELVSQLADVAVPSDAARNVLTALATSDRNVSAVPLNRISVGGTERYSLPREEAEAFVADRLGNLELRQGSRPRIEVLNGNGRTGTTRLVAETLVRRGFEVIRTDNADSFDYAETRVVAQGRENRSAGAEVVNMLDVGQLELELRIPSGVVDVSIIVGDDIPTGEG